MYPVPLTTRTSHFVSILTPCCHYRTMVPSQYHCAIATVSLYAESGKSKERGKLEGPILFTLRELLEAIRHYVVSLLLTVPL